MNITVRRTSILLLVFSLMASGCASTLGGSASKARKQAEAMEIAKEASDALRTQLVENGDRAMYVDDAQAAILQYVEALQIREDPDLFIRLGSAYQRAGNLDKASRALQRALALDESSAIAWERLGLIHLNNRKPVAGRKYLERALQLDSNRWRSHNGLGIAADLRGDFTSAADHYKAALSLNERSAMLWSNYGYSFYLLGDYEQAEQNFDKALELDRKYPRAWANLALVQARRGDYREAIELLIKVRKEHIAYNDIGYVALLNKDLDQAERFFKRSAKSSPVYYVPAHQNMNQLRDMRVANREASEQLANDQSTESQVPPTVADETTPEEAPQVEVDVFLEPQETPLLEPTSSNPMIVEEPVASSHRLSWETIAPTGA